MQAGQDVCLFTPIPAPPEGSPAAEKQARDDRKTK
jgi:hypothetical protein